MFLLLKNRTQSKCNGYHYPFEDILHGSQSILKYFPDLVSKISVISESVWQLRIILKSDENFSGMFCHYSFWDKGLYSMATLCRCLIVSEINKKVVRYGKWEYSKENLTCLFIAVTRAVAYLNKYVNSYYVIYEIEWNKHISYIFRLEWELKYISPYF